MAPRLSSRKLPRSARTNTRDNLEFIREPNDNIPTTFVVRYILTKISFTVKLEMNCSHFFSVEVESYDFL